MCIRDRQEPASGQSAEQFNLIVATSDLPDIMYYSWATSYPGGPDAVSYTHLDVYGRPCTGAHKKNQL